ncbi:hypothetical protein HX875_16585 [Pseudomonas yamanorum]|uniref:hypothetical protein n=1 Tax=Pseudomonas yamanorum TaxID=515393 RepID=UPI0015A0CE9D|nr:hypothetical protein [Pseudomonas yamanorum]NWE41095.1 hypothetical protein [Pseudomonas yamanorum]
MSNLSINTSVPMNLDYRSLDQEQGGVNKPRNNLLPNSFSNAVVRDHDAGSKDSNVTVTRDSLQKLFEMFDSVVKAMRNMLATQGSLPKPMSEVVPLPKVPPEAGPAPKVVPEANPALKVAPAPVPKVQADLGVLAKVMPGPLPEVRRDAEPQNKPMNDINVTVQVANCHCPHPEAKVAPRTTVTREIDGRATVVPHSPVKPGVDANTLVVPNLPILPQVDTKTLVLPQSPVKPGNDGKTPLIPQPPVKSEVDKKTPIVPQPDVTPDVRPTPEPDLTAPGPAEDCSTNSFNKYNRSRFDSPRQFDNGRRTRA